LQSNFSQKNFAANTKDISCCNHHTNGLMIRNIDENKKVLDSPQRKIQITSPTKPTIESQTKIKRKHGLKSSTKVRFSNRVLYRNIPHLNNISKQQIDSTWYTQEEYLDIKSKLELTLKSQKSGLLGLDNCEELCFRGLEARTRQGSILRKTNQWNALEAVLHEQDRQSSLGMYSSDDVAKIYVNNSFRARCGARAKGLSDAREASAGSTKEEIQESRMEKSSVQNSKNKETVSRITRMLG
jgi:hypothetical protein